MPDPAKKAATYEDLYSIPENMTGEIIDGDLYVTPRPSRRHARAVTVMGYFIGPAYDRGEKGGPGGWIFLDEPEISMERIKRLGTRKPCSGGLKKAAGLFKLVLGLRGNKPFHPKGVFRFSSFEEKEEWTKKMMAR